MTGQQAPASSLPAGRTRLHFDAEIESHGAWGSTTPSVSVRVEYDPGDREAAIDLLQGIVDAARAETKAPEPTSQVNGAHFSGISPEDLADEIARRTRAGRTPR